MTPPDHQRNKKVLFSALLSPSNNCVKRFGHRFIGSIGGGSKDEYITCQRSLHGVQSYANKKLGKELPGVPIEIVIDVDNMWTTSSPLMTLFCCCSGPYHRVKGAFQINSTLAMHFRSLVVGENKLYSMANCRYRSCIDQEFFVYLRSWLLAESSSSSYKTREDIHLMYIP